jgi:hypothetical protein
MRSIVEDFSRRCRARHHPAREVESCAQQVIAEGGFIEAIQMGHVHLDTTLGYARLYDGTLAADYHRAMLSIECALNVSPDAPSQPLSPAHIVALLDALKSQGTLNTQQLDVLSTARAAVVGLAQSG